MMKQLVAYAILAQMAEIVNAACMPWVGGRLVITALSFVSTFDVTYTHSHKYTNTHNHKHTRTRALIHARTLSLSLSHTHTHTHAHTHAHTHTHTLTTCVHSQTLTLLKGVKQEQMEQILDRFDAREELWKGHTIAKQGQLVRACLCVCAMHANVCTQTCVCVWGGGGRVGRWRGSVHVFCVYEGGVCVFLCSLREELWNCHKHTHTHTICKAKVNWCVCVRVGLCGCGCGFVCASRPLLIPCCVLPLAGQPSTFPSRTLE